MQLANTVSVAGFLLACTFSGCVSASRVGDQEKRRADFIGPEEISRSASTNAWDLMRSRIRQYDFAEDRYGRPRTIRTKRGRSTIAVADSDTPLVVVDGARLVDFGVLRDLPTGAIASIELLSGINGTSAHGTNAAAGVIYIHTWEASSK
ncbi:MAG: TonB-dependent receptor plug domain-containing protein [Gemmatimonadaceae bacterium]